MLCALLSQASSSQELLIDSLDLLADLYSRFPSIPSSDKGLQRASLEALLASLPHDRAAVRKRAVLALGALAASSTSEIFTALASAIITALDAASGAAGAKEQEKARTMVQLVATLARTCPARIGRRLPELMPRILAAVQSEDDELREATLQAMEAILLRCPADVTPFVIQIVDEAVKLLRHDPVSSQRGRRTKPSEDDVLKPLATTELCRRRRLG
jgi:cullin-associated NEDD8-dissociated protein 1